MLELDPIGVRIFVNGLSVCDTSSGFHCVQSRLRLLRNAIGLIGELASREKAASHTRDSGRPATIYVSSILST